MKFADEYPKPYCQIAKKLLHRNIVCGVKCPLINNCPRLILEDANSEAIDKAVEALLKVKDKK